MDNQEKIIELEEKIKALEKTLSAKEKICQVLMNRVERSMVSVGGAYYFFERNILLQNMIDQRSEELAEANRKLSEEIIERIKSEEIVRENEDFLKKLINSIPIPVFFKNVDGYYVDCNIAFEKFVGVNRDNLIGRNVFDISPRELAEVYTSKDIELFKNPGIQQYESLVKDGSGITRDVIFNKAVVSSCKGKVIGLIGTILDITEQKYAIDELQKSQKKYKDIFDNAMEGIFQSTIEGRFINVNPALVRMFGYDTSDEMISEITDIESQIYADPEEFKKIRRLLNENGIVKNYEVQVKRKDASSLWVSMNVQSVYDSDKNIKYIEGTSLDISEQKFVTQEREKLINELQLALSNVKTLSGLLPICANCKKIRDDKGYWNQIETYISEHSDTVFSHGICPECARKLYPGLYDED